MLSKSAGVMFISYACMALNIEFALFRGPCALAMRLERLIHDNASIQLILNIIALRLLRNCIAYRDSVSVVYHFETVVYKIMSVTIVHYQRAMLTFLLCLK